MDYNISAAEVELNGPGGEMLMTKWQLNPQVVGQHLQSFVTHNSTGQSFRESTHLFVKVVDPSVVIVKVKRSV